MKELLGQCKEYITVSIIRAMQVTAVIIKEYHCWRLHTQFYTTFFCQA
jgi:hypothetical protein